MSSRQEQKERRRREREERERAERNAAKRKQLGQIVAGVVVVAAVVIGIVLAASGSGNGGGSDDEAVQAAPPSPLTPPPQRETDLKKAVAAAGCAFREFESEGQDHVGDQLTIENYETNPPTSGAHNPVPATDGYYPPGSEPELRNWVHSLEHGRILLQYNPRLPQRRVRQLQGLYNEDVRQSGNRYHMIMLRNNTNMKYAAAAVSWTRYVVCNQVNDRTFDAFRIFRDQFVDEAPEQVP